MRLPTDTRQHINIAKATMLEHSRHEFLPIKREKLIAQLHNTISGDVVVAWLAILTARHVQPLFTTHVGYAADLSSELAQLNPEILITKAIAVLEDGKPVDEAYAYACDTHYTIEDFSTTIPLPALLAVRAANIALMTPHDDFRPFETLKQQVLVNNEIREARFITEEEEIIHGRDFSDAIWAMSPYCDSAAAAATAFACEGDMFINHPARLKQFWLWWFDEAIPTAWHRAHI